MSNLCKLGVINAGGLGKVVADTAERAGWAEVVFSDPRFKSDKQRHAHWALVGLPEDAASYKCDGYSVAIGNSHARKQWCAWLLVKFVAGYKDPVSDGLEGYQAGRHQSGWRGDHDTF